MSTGKIKVKAMAIYVAHGRMLVTPSYDSVKKQPYYRLLGGHVEFGERAEETLRREMLEELAADIEVLERLDVVENVFIYEGRDYHEIVFIHHARFLDDAITRRDDLRNLEADHEEIFRWLPVGDVIDGDIPLYPVADYRRYLASIAGKDA
jgi:ADP-ribose pyrophosphatase YjhB (NUDIX family)